MGANKDKGDDVGISGEEALKHVKSPTGPFNWVLFRPNANKLDLFNAGGEGVDEMLSWLQETEVLYGLIRMGFGEGQFLRQKWISVWWRGDQVKPLKMGPLVALQDKSLKNVDPVSVTVLAQQMEEISLEIIIEKVKKASIIDGDTSDASAFSMSAYLAALKAEMDKSRAYFAK